MAYKAEEAGDKKASYEYYMNALKAGVPEPYNSQIRGRFGIAPVSANAQYPIIPEDALRRFLAENEGQARVTSDGRFGSPNRSLNPGLNRPAYQNAPNNRDLMGQNAHMYPNTREPNGTSDIRMQNDEADMIYGIKFCEICGARLRKIGNRKFCPECGAEYEDG
ncbi:MAG: hypothetical protein ACTSU2_07000 [Promethearchaeota archaeon]